VLKIPINPSAQKLFQESLAPFSRVLILGGSGWFGRTALSMIGELGPDFLVIGRYPREIVVNGKVFSVSKWDRARVERFQPDLVLDFAFLTKDSIQLLGEQEFARQNRRTSERLFSLAELGTVRNLLTVSSGAAIMRTVDFAGGGQDLYGTKNSQTRRRCEI
jgi:nucleoside-diphosphate-sugar epimerase